MSFRRVIIHSTPGHIDPVSFTVFGINAKPNSTNPIGVFGTGLKYAIAVLMRHDIKVTLFIGQEEYVFYTQQSDFRGKAFARIRMKKRKGLLSRWQYFDLPFTTELGKTWKLWQAFRELHANTLDEGGITAEEYHDPAEATYAKEGRTVFVIEDQRYIDEYLDRDRNFLPEGKKVREEGDGRVQVLDAPSKHIYYRGMRIMDLDKEARFTYNFLEHVELTEDRTAKYPWDLEGKIGTYWIESDDDEKVKKAVQAPSTSFEGSMSYAYSGGSYRANSPFNKYAATSSNVAAKGKWNGLQPTVVSEVRVTIILPIAGLEQEERDHLLEQAKLIHKDAVLFTSEDTEDPF